MRVIQMPSLKLALRIFPTIRATRSREEVRIMEHTRLAVAPLPNAIPATSRLKVPPLTRSKQPVLHSSTNQLTSEGSPLRFCYPPQPFPCDGILAVYQMCPRPSVVFRNGSSKQMWIRMGLATAAILPHGQFEMC